MFLVSVFFVISQIHIGQIKCWFRKLSGLQNSISHINANLRCYVIWNVSSHQLQPRNDQLSQASMVWCGSKHTLNRQHIAVTDINGRCVVASNSMRLLCKSMLAKTNLKNVNLFLRITKEVITECMQTWSQSCWSAIHPNSRRVDKLGSGLSGSRINHARSSCFW